MLPAAGRQHGAATGGTEMFLFLMIVYLMDDLSEIEVKEAGLFEEVTNVFFTLFVLRDGKCNL